MIECNSLQKLKITAEKPDELTQPKQVLLPPTLALGEPLAHDLLAFLT